MSRLRAVTEAPNFVSEQWWAELRTLIWTWDEDGDLIAAKIAPWERLPATRTPHLSVHADNQEEARSMSLEMVELMVARFHHLRRLGR